MTKEELIKKAAERGIVPGAVCRSPYGTEWTVGPSSFWRTTLDGDLYDTSPICESLLRCALTGWATVITPAPQEQPTKGLVDGMACEPDEHMRKAIVVRAKELGLAAKGSGYNDFPLLVWRPLELPYPLKQTSWKASDKTIITPGEFYDRLCAMPPQPKPIIIDGREVKYLKGGDIKVGCTTVSAADIDTIHEQSLKNR